MKYWKHITAFILVFSLIYLVYPYKTYAAFSYARSITVNAAQVPSTQTSFPMLFSGTYNGSGGTLDLRTVGNGGKVQNASGYDIGFYSNSNCSTGKLNWETESYNASTGAVVYWINVSSISNGTTIYICYGDASISTDQSNPTGVWDSSYKGIYHLPNGSVLSANDSTGVYNGTIPGAGVTVSTGKFDGGLTDNDTGYNSITTSNNVTSAPTVTGSVWVKTSQPTDPNNYTIFVGNQDYPNSGWLLFSSGPSFPVPLVFMELNPNVSNPATFAESLMTDGNWHYLVGTGDSSGAKIYLDGTLMASGTSGTFTADASKTIYMATSGSGTAVQEDEIRVSNIVRSADWITTEYNNQSAPSSFYTVGGETNLSSINKHKFAFSANHKFVFSANHKYIFQ